MSITPVKECRVCHIPANKLPQGSIKTCSGCRMAYYCSTQCQKKDWKGHKTLCKVEKATVIVREGTMPLRAYSQRIASESLITPYSNHKNLKRASKQKPYTEPKRPTLTKSEALEKAKNAIATKDILSFMDTIGVLDTTSYYEFLKEAIENWPHPILYLELSRACAEKSTKATRKRQKQMFYKQYRVYKALGLKLVQIDAACIKNDPSCIAAVGQLNLKYSDLVEKQKNLEKHKDEYLKFFDQEVEKVIPNLSKCSSPEWIAKHGMMLFLGILADCESPEKCLEIRKTMLQEAKKELRDGEIKKK